MLNPSKKNKKYKWFCNYPLCMQKIDYRSYQEGIQSREKQNSPELNQTPNYEAIHHGMSW